ncbi:MAG: hypothetical protein R3F42_08625 [Pseudomonadota bacterium]
MNLDSARNEIKHPARIPTRGILVEAAVLVIIAAMAVLLLY